MKNIHDWEKLTFSKRSHFSWKENLKKCTSFEQQKGAEYIRGNVYYGILVFSCLSSAKSGINFFFICFPQEINGFYRSSLGNVVDFTDIMNIFPDILAKRWNFKKLRNFFVDERAVIITTFIFPCHWKTLILFYLRKKRPENTFLTLTVNYGKSVQKNKLSH